jgi:hypothetical protein
MNELGLKKIAFVAMPFGVKPTGLAPGKGPAEVDFDALWDKAIYPALSGLNYLPIRADNQIGSVIIKDMLEQLVFADLVLADISIPNGNVYYEAGVRHAARDKGCVLISAQWARPLFDLAQITSLRYPWPASSPEDDDYQAIVTKLVDGIPPLTESVGPVFELTAAGDDDARDTSHLKEISSVLFEFQNNLRAAKIKAADGERAPLRNLVNSDDLDDLPAYALDDLIRVARDNLEWAELMALIDRLPDSIAEKPFFLEQKALAMSKVGSVRDAVALLETVIEKYGETPERLGTIGDRYRELARDEPNKGRKRRYQAKAIDAYRLGMTLDLNQYYCAYKLIVALMDRGRADDEPEAARCAHLVKAAAERARSLGSADEWLDSTMAVLAFFDQDETRAHQIVDRILDQEWANWKLVGLSQDLESALGWIDEADRAPFTDIFDELHSSLPVSQDALMSDVMPLIKAANEKYRKFQKVHARPADPGEVITSTTADGEETTNRAGADDMVVKNLTEAREQYIVGKNKFESRYTPVEAVDDKWTLYAPLGEVMAIDISREITDSFDVGAEFYIVAPWGSEQLSREGDKFVAPLPGLDEIYRIARQEFDETYQPKPVN